MSPPSKIEAPDGLDETPDARHTAARRYLATVPLMDEYVDQIAAHLGDSAARRAQLRVLLHPHREAIETAHMTVMLRHYSVAEIEALTQFQASPAGRAIMRKVAAVQAELLPALIPLLRSVVEDALRAVPVPESPR